MPDVPAQINPVLNPSQTGHGTGSASSVIDVDAILLSPAPWISMDAKLKADQSNYPRRDNEEHMQVSVVKLEQML